MHSEKDRIPVVRDTQRDWVEHLDEDAEFYVLLFLATEHEQRRLQFLCDVTAAGIETQPDKEWEL